ncbi:MAG TPA: cation:proton antiporter [Symbiobacteriaceae bacterium]|nr:cation:proton antiporter [Symbiobacteriaceae bacterium]
MEQSTVHITSLVVVAILAFVVPITLSRIRRWRIPVAVGEIIAGILVGKSGLHLIHVDDTLQLFNFLGLACLMFLSGLEIDFQALSSGNKGGARSLKERLHNPLLLGLLLFGASLFGSYQFAHLLTDQGVVRDSITLTLVVATCGLSIIMPVLKEREMLDKPFGMVVMAAAVMGDFLPMLGLSVVAAIRTKGSAVDALLLLVLLGAGVVAYLLGKRLSDYDLLEGLRHGTSQIGVRAAFALMLVLLLLAETLGVEAIVGAFVAGLCVSLLVGPSREELTHKLDAMSFGFLIPVFFLMVGIQFDLRALLANPKALLMVPILALATFALKGVPALSLAIWHPWRKTVGGAFLLGTQMSVTIAASAVALKIGAYDGSFHSAVVLAAILSAVIGPVLFNALMPADAEPVKREGVIAVGAGPLSRMLAQQVAKTGEACIVIDNHASKVSHLVEAGVDAVEGDGTTAEGLRQIGGDAIRALIAMTGNDQVNLAAARAARALGVERVVVFAHEADRWSEGKREGFEMINPDMAPVFLAGKMLSSPEVAGLMQSDDVQLWDARLTSSHYVGRSLRLAAFPPEVLVVSIRRGEQRIVPNGDTVLQHGDTLTLAGTVTTIRIVRRLLR